MKSTIAWRAWTTHSSTVPTITPKKVFSIFLYSFLVHYVSIDIPVLKWQRVGCFVMLLKWQSTSLLPLSAAAVHQLMKWSLKRPLWSWWWILGVKHWNISLWGKSAQNGFTGCNPWLTNAFDFRPSACCLRISIIFLWSRGFDHASKPCSLCGTKHRRHWLSIQQVTRHCSGKSVMYAARMACNQHLGGG